MRSEVDLNMLDAKNIYLYFNQKRVMESNGEADTTFTETLPRFQSIRS